ncbi:Tripartite tricarboxylate transporter TctA family protein [Aquimixticola soesokkakensis]|uniref:Tripartite tricarboxylate transporter TctA family protein n=1 Tax=Aquimixticola soesokkakensis TaxID=1519096 RepID=A0A1Y5RUB5_9RHOB|nr:tripartite tricarboxylate transporter permease [Aquimixticola soesokkakensis]SLN22914.1 Tripartite tricarboxylate transporter TctA family protein [Aquimixticola soesokkakensis]
MAISELAYMMDAAGQAMGTLMSLERIGFLVVGVVVGLSIGLLPGIGGMTGFALLVPFTYTMDPFAAFAMLLGMHSVTSTSDTIPAVLFGVPGTAASQATVLDGFPMTRKGEAGRALSAGFTASLFGGIFGAVVLALSIPVIRPFVLAIGTPELLAMTVFGIAMVSALSGNAPLRGVVAACFGILVGMIGTDSQTGTIRWAGNILYLWDGVPMLPVLLGMFALPELCDLSIKRSALAEKMEHSITKGMLRGARDVLENWFLVIRCSSIGALLGIIPGITGSVTDWIAYGHAIRSEKGAKESFSTGDVRGVIAPESANNAKEGGSLVPTIAFGVPGSASQAILLGALMVHGFVPGPEMLTTNLDVTYTLVWSIALANIFGAGLCFLLSGQFAKISTLRYTLVLPAIIAVVFVGAFQGSGSWGDLYALMFFGVVGWAMKRLKWPRPPLILGLVLGALIERYMSISIQRFGGEWLSRPVVILLLGMATMVLLRPVYTEFRAIGARAFVPRGRFSVRAEDLLYVFFLAIGGYMLVEAQSWSFGARVGPTAVALTMLVAGGLSLIFLLFSGRGSGAEADTSHRGIHMDLASDDGHHRKIVLLRAGVFFGWFLAFLILMATIGLIPTVPVLIVAYMRLEGNEPWKLTLVYAACVTVAIYVVFDQVIHVPWPNTLIGERFAWFAQHIPSM